MSCVLDFNRLEEKWQSRWAEAKAFEANPDPAKPKYYLTVAYPYPNAPQHIGHARTYALADAHARYMRMRGYNVLLPMAFHYTGTPILAMSKRVIAGDRELMDVFVKLYGVPEEVIPSFADPINIASHFHRDLKLGMQEMGFSIDWRREFTTVKPQYSKFIEWQFHQLYAKGLITKGAHPIGWCPSCKNPVGQHDTLGDKEPEVGEFTAIKFDLDGVALPAATLRPETIYGVTNLWLNPDAQYVEISLSGQRMIVSRMASAKLKGQYSGVEVLRDIVGASLIGRQVTNPVTKGKVTILPASFVDPANATGVVMSVPAHAPYDLLALRELKSSRGALSKFGISDESLAAIEPIPVVKLDGYSEIPAKDIVERMGIKGQLDAKAEDATKELYQKEFHTASMRPETGKYAGMPVSRAKEDVKKDLLADGSAFLIYEVINGPIKCRCGSEVVVNLLGDQWFINYGDEAWKSVVREHLKGMSLVPEDLRQEFMNVVDWLKEKACARRAGLGTRLPWDRDWIIESLSDSTIYMAYYTVSNVINARGIGADQLDDATFDYVFLGKGDPATLKVGREAAEAMRSEFTYFYPLDSRHSGRDLVPNHLTFFVFNHVAIFPRECWPRQIAVNGSVLMDGKKMSKSLGNIIPLRKAIKIYGADTLRVSILSASELLQDADFSDTLARSTKSKLQEFYSLALQYSDAGALDRSKLDQMDRWVLSRTQKVVQQVVCAMDCLRVREAINASFFTLQQDLQWYIRRKGDCCSNPNVRAVIKYVLETIVRLIAPFAPHVCEELWERMGGSGFVSVARYPAVDQALVDERIEIAENFIKGVVADTSEITRVTGIVPTKICYYTAPRWKWDAYLKAMRIVESGADPKQLVREAMRDPDIRGRGGEAAKFIGSVSQCIVSMQREERQRMLQVGGIDEPEALKSSLPFLSSLFRCGVDVYPGDAPAYDPKKKAGQASPMRPAIYVEGNTCSPSS